MTVLLAVTVLSVLLAVAMSAVAWRAAREERRRSEARVAALAAEIHHVTPLAVNEPHPRADLPLRAEPPRLKAVTPPTTDLFAAVQPASSSSRSVVAVAASLFVFATAVALVVALSSGSRPAKVAAGVGSAKPATSQRESGSNGARQGDGNSANIPSAVPIELVALGHERDADRLTVRGVIRNPGSGARVERLSVVVFLFNRDGGFLASGRAAVEAPSLAPGGESTFVVTAPAAAGVDRYRVSFRTDAGIVPHVDRRKKS
jgi:hypothetical protein